MMLSDRGLNIAKERRIRTIQVAMRGAQDGYDLLTWAAIDGLTYERKIAEAVEPLLAEADAKAATNQGAPTMIRTDGTPTICHPNVAQLERKATPDNVSFLETPPEVRTISEHAAYQAGLIAGAAGRRSA